MNLGEKVILSMIHLSLEKNKVKEVYDIIEPFLDTPIDIDLKSLCRIEVIVNEHIIKFPTKQEWRKIKLKHLDKIGEPELIYDANLIREFYKNYFNNSEPNVI